MAETDENGWVKFGGTIYSIPNGATEGSHYFEVDQEGEYDPDRGNLVINLPHGQRWRVKAGDWYPLTLLGINPSVVSGETD